MTWKRSATIVGLSIVGGLVGMRPLQARPNTDLPPGTSGEARESKAGTSKEGVIDPRAEAALKHMTNYLTGLRSMRVDTTTIDEKVATTGQKIQEVKESRVEMKRPNGLAIERNGPMGRVLFRYDGKRFVLYGIGRNIYASGPAPATIDAAIDEARDRFGIDAPAGDLIATDSYQSLLDGVTEGRYVGLEPVGGVMTHHLAMRKGTTDYQLWIKDGPEPVPVRYVITSRDLQGAPQFTLELHNFEANVALSDGGFTLNPPPGATQVALSGNK
jgi:hypothetical protein